MSYRKSIITVYFYRLLPNLSVILINPLFPRIGVFQFKIIRLKIHLQMISFHFNIYVYVYLYTCVRIDIYI